MKLTVLERIVILNLLPTEGDFLTLRVCQEARELLEFPVDEQREVELVVQEDKRVHWNAEKDPKKDINLSQSALDIIIKRLKELDESKKLDNETFPLYEKLVFGPRLVSEENNG